MMNHKPIAVLQTFLSGATVHLMSADYVAVYGTDKAVSHPVTNRLHALYENLSQVPSNLPDGTQISLPTTAIQAPLGPNSSVYNDLVDENGNSIASVHPSIDPITVGLILGALVLVLLITIVAEFIFADFVRLRVKEMTPPCASTIDNLSNVNPNIALVQNPDCSTYTIDKNTGQVVSQLGQQFKPPEGTLGSIQNIVMIAALGIGGIFLLKYLLDRPRSRNDVPDDMSPAEARTRVERLLA